MKCDGCTFCCRVLDVPWLDKPAGELCRHATETGGCSLWPHNTPALCKAFACMYRRETKCSPSLKPDACGVMFEQIDDKIVLGTVRKLVTKPMMSQVKAFNRMGLSVVLSEPGNRRKQVFPAPGTGLMQVTSRVEEILREAQNGRA